MNGLFVFVTIIFVVTAFVGYKQGLIKILVSLLATLIMFTLVTMLTPYVSNLIREATPLEKTVQKKMSDAFALDGDSNMRFDEVDLPRDAQIALIEAAELPDIFREMLLTNNNNEAYETLGVSTFGAYVAAYISKVIADVVAFLIILVILIVAFPIVIKALGIINKLPVIGGINRLAGGVLGLGIGLAVVWVVFIILTLMYDTSLGRECFENIESSAMLKALYDKNILMNYIVKF